MNVNGHIPVMVDIVVRFLLGNGGYRYIDCTINGCGHALALLKAAERPIKLLGIDIDPTAISLARERLSAWEGVTLVQDNFANLDKIIQNWDECKLDGILVDFGISTNQLDQRDRGFSYRFDTPVDMRFDQSSGQPADELINTCSQETLARIIREHGGERFSARIAAAIVRNRPVQTTRQFADIVRNVCPGQWINKTLSRVFLSIRSVINDEISNIERLLPSALDLLDPGGRMVLISFDSREDAPVKSFIRQRSATCICPPEFPTCICNTTPELKPMTRGVIRPSEEEIAANPRSRSSRMRAFEKL